MWNRFVRFCEGMLGYELSLEKVTEPTRVSLICEVCSPNVVKSPVTPVVSGFLDWCIFARRIIEQGSGSGGRYEETFRHIASGRLGDELLLSTPHGTIRVPLDSVSFTPHAPIAQSPQPLVTAPPLIAEALAKVPNSAHDGDELFYGERFVGHGDEVSLKAVVRPVAGSKAGPYRGGERGADFEVDVEQEIRLREISTLM